MYFKRIAAVAMALAAGLFATMTTAIAQDRQSGAPEPGQIGFQQPATEIMERIVWFHDDFLLVITTVIALFVLALLVWVIVRYNAKANPEPAKFSHNTLIEVIWTGIPVLILIVIAVPSFRLLYFEDTVPEADVVIKATGHQWYWTYEYPDEDSLTFDALMLPSNYWDANAPQDVKDERAEVEADIQRMLGRTGPLELRRLLDTDTRVVVPVGKIVKVLVSADDVLHAWTVPAFGVKVDAVPGRNNELWFQAEAVGTYYGQCSELCGIRHAFMPIVVEVVTEREYASWLLRAKSVYASNSTDGSSRLASAGSVQ